MPYKKHYVTDKKLSEKTELLTLIWKDDFNTMKPKGTMGAWYHWLFSDLEDFQRNSELEKSFSHLYSLGHRLHLKALCYVCVLDGTVRTVG